MPAASKIAIGKAATSAVFRRPTIKLEELVQNERLTMLALNNIVDQDYVPLKGAYPILIHDEVIGAVSAAGAITGDNDEIIAQFASKTEFILKIAKMKRIPILLCFSLWITNISGQVFYEKYGNVCVEAENFYSQSSDSIRKWHIIRETSVEIKNNHAGEASGKAYTKILPDERVTHDDPFIPGENFSDNPGEMAVISYKIHFTDTGKYYVWVKAYSSGTEDNGIHVGLDGKWPESGMKMQWCEGKNQWTWDSRQRTNEQHCGVQKLIYLIVETPGKHLISFSMREDGFEFDKWCMSKEYTIPED
ncbi:MAG: heme-binding protein [Bacteroidales bacterium]|nr:heme-binding protein [Bacteroidales bacterium]